MSVFPHRASLSIPVLVVTWGCAGPLPVLSPSSSEEGSSGPNGATDALASADDSSGDGSSGPNGATETTADATSGTTGESSPECGNRQVEDGESCDGTNLVGSTCESLRQAPGTLSCTAACTFDVSECVPPGMVLVPGGEFTMGSMATKEEQPVRQVTLDAFWIDETEVTAAEYAVCASEGSCEPTPTGGNFNYMVTGQENHPINGTTWSAAMQYCGWVDGGVKRLPTEAEWEKAARGTDSRTYPWGEEPATCERAVMAEGGEGCGLGATWPVGSKPLGASPHGAMDMAGNVFEWVYDWSGTYDIAETSNPSGPMTGKQRVVRGGAYYIAGSAYFRTSYRYSYPPESQLDFVGFRCVRSPDSAE